MVDRKCSKCGNNDLYIKYRNKNELITSSWPRGKGTPDLEFLYYSEYDFYYKVVAAKEHLEIVCRTCQYKWREKINKQ